MKYTGILLITLLSIASGALAQKRIVILHTNDTHSQIEPLPANDRYNPNMGGVVNRKAIIDSIRNIEKNVLLLDAGDFVQGTPYFNMFHGRVEVEAMNRLQYDVAAIGNHEFDDGLDTMKMMFNKMNFPIICSNYDFSETVLKDAVKPYVVINKDGIKIGIVGVGIDPEGLIQKNKYPGMKFKPVNETVNYYADILKNKKKCDLVICLSHIGLELDRELAQSSKYIDVIIGGHSHTFMMNGPEEIRNAENKDVLVYQAGGKGAYIGEVVIELNETKK